MKVLNLEPRSYSPKAREIIESVAEYMELSNPPDFFLHRVGSIRHADVIIVRLARQIDRAGLDMMPNLKAIVTPATGTDHIDLDAAKERGIEVLSLKGKTEFLNTVPATAEHTWALLLALVRRIPWAFDDVKAGRWERDSWRGMELKGKTLGIVGMGRVGRQVYRYAREFNMELQVSDTEGAGVHIRASQRTNGHAICLARDLPKCDILTLHVPLDDSTRGMIGAEALAKTKILINTSRGEVVQEGALLEALESGQLAGAALDVVAGEREGRNEALVDYARKHDNLIITPHIAGATHESMEATEVFMAQKLKKWIGAA